MFTHATSSDVDGSSAGGTAPPTPQESSLWRLLDDLGLAVDVPTDTQGAPGSQREAVFRQAVRARMFETWALGPFLVRLRCACFKKDHGGEVSI